MIKKFNKFLNEDYEGIFDKIKGSKNKIDSTLKTHGYNSPEEFISDVDKINKYSEILQTDSCDKSITIENILRVYRYKQEFEDIFPVIDELEDLLLEIKDEGFSIAIRFQKHGIRSFLIQISSTKELTISNMYLIFGVLMETEGRGEISFIIESIKQKSILLRTFVDDPKILNNPKKKTMDDVRQVIRGIVADEYGRYIHDESGDESGEDDVNDWYN